MVNTTDTFTVQAKKIMAARKLTQVRVALDLGENPVQLSQLLSGIRPQKRIRAKLARYLGIEGEP